MVQGERSGLRIQGVKVWARVRGLRLRIKEWDLELGIEGETIRYVGENGKGLVDGV
jgi:hypothetical protein